MLLTKQCLRQKIGKRQWRTQGLALVDRCDTCGLTETVKKRGEIRLLAHSEGFGLPRRGNLRTTRFTGWVIQKKVFRGYRRTKKEANELGPTYIYGSETWPKKKSLKTLDTAKIRMLMWTMGKTVTVGTRNDAIRETRNVVNGTVKIQQRRLHQPWRKAPEEGRGGGRGTTLIRHEWE